MKSNNKFEVLDCTIRDGGFLNNWRFDEKLVKETYRNLSKSGVDIIELGYRHAPSADKGIWHFTPEKLINNLFSDISGAPIALMMDTEKADLSLIPKSGNSLVKMYRVATHKGGTDKALKLCDKLKNRGYRTSLQLMGVIGYSDKEMAETVKDIRKSSIDYIYFADSYGSLYPNQIKKYVDILKHTDKKVGFHSHNSLQLAFANTLEAIRCGASIVDGTVYGMGRGAGNLPLEVLVIYLEKALKDRKYNSAPVLDLIDRYFLKLHNEIKWGYCLPYMLSGIFEVHPYFSERLVSYHEFTVDDIVKTLEVIKDMKPVGFNPKLIDDVIDSGFIKPYTAPKQRKAEEKQDFKKVSGAYSVDYLDRHKGRDFLILANGATLKEHKKEISKFIAKYDPVVLGANYLGGLFKPDYHAFSNKKRFITYIDQVDKKSILLLSTSFEEAFIKEYTSEPFERLVHLNRTAHSFGIKEGIISSNCRTVSILLIGAAIAMGARRIFIAGMDGYKSKDNFNANKMHFYKESEEAENFKLLIEKHNLNELMLKSINSYLTSRNREGLHIITPTSHNHFYSSIINWIK